MFCLLPSSINLNDYSLNVCYAVTLEKTPFVEPDPKCDQAVTAAAIGGFVGGMVFGVLATLIVAGIIFAVVKMTLREAARK